MNIIKQKVFATILLAMVVSVSFGQSFEIRTAVNDMGYIEVQMRETSGGTNLPLNSSGDKIGDIAFAIKWDSSLGTDLAFLCSTSAYNMTDPSGVVHTDQTGWDYRYYTANNTPFIVPSDWVVNEWETIAIYYAVGGSGSNAEFQIAEQNFGISTLNWAIGYDGTPPYNPYSPAINGSVSSYSYPTTVYNYVWVGGGVPSFETNWFMGGNWKTACGVAQVSGPNATSNILIPDVTSASGFFPDANLVGSMVCNNLRIASGAQLTVPATNGSLTVSEKLFTDGSLIIIPNADATISGDTYIGSSESIIIQADENGVGSFIDNGTITYGGSGSAKVQTYLTGSGSYNTFDFHCVGPTVDITGTGVTLAAFNVVPGETFAYQYSEPTNTWDNYYAITDPVPTAKGIGLSTRDGSTNTMEMTGVLNTGPILSEFMTIGGGGNYLLSNPYPSSVFWNNLFSNNSAIVADKVYVLDDGFDGNYRAYNQGSGGTYDFTGYIQVGQGFFVSAVSASQFTFNNGDRYHSNAEFYKSATYSNRLDVRVSGNDSRDGLLVHFYEGAVSGYEANEDVEKKMSYYTDATQFWTVLENNQKMSINALPYDLLGMGMQSIPMSFICSADGEYLMEFYDIESFDLGTEIWLEDKLTGGDWVSLNTQPEYNFTASSDDASDRFVLHFFGPTGTEELSASTVDLYSFGPYAYVRNNTEETIKEIRVYNLSGALMNQVHTPDQKFLKLWIDDQMAYYVITVITDQQVYTKKLFISK